MVGRRGEPLGEVIKSRPLCQEATVQKKCFRQNEWEMWRHYEELVQCVWV